MYVHYFKSIVIRNLLVSLGFTVFCLGLVSCENYKAPEPRTKIYVTLDDLNKDTLIVLPTNEFFTTIRLDTKGNVSDTAIIRIGTERVFSNNWSRILVLPKVNISNYYETRSLADTLFIEYKPYKKDITGDLTIEFTLYNDQ